MHAQVDAVLCTSHSAHVLSFPCMVHTGRRARDSNVKAETVNMDKKNQTVGCLDCIVLQAVPGYDCIIIEKL